ERLQSALRFMDAIFTNVAPKFATLIGATQGHEALAQTGLSFVEELRARANDDPDLKLAVAQVLLRLSGVQGAFGANQLGDYEGSLKSIDAAIELLQTLPVHYRPADRLKALHEAQLRAAQAL